VVYLVTILLQILHRYAGEKKLKVDQSILKTWTTVCSLLFWAIT